MRAKHWNVCILAALALGIIMAPAVVRAGKGMSFVSGGEFEMGDTYEEGNPDELPVHTVYVDAFYVDRCEMANGEVCDILQWALEQNKIRVVPGQNGGPAGSVLNADGAPYELLDLDDKDVQIQFVDGAFGRIAGKEQHPCVEMGWHGAAAVMNFRSEREGLEPCFDLNTWTCDFDKNGYRLPTEAEWEKAARGGQVGHHFPWNSIGGSFMDHIGKGKACYGEGEDPDAGRPLPRTVPVVAFPANKYGLHNMSGNIYEWCYDVYDPGYYSHSPAQNPTGPGGTGGERVRRGGCWAWGPELLRCAYRGHRDPQHKGKHVGFRGVRSAGPRVKPEEPVHEPQPPPPAPDQETPVIDAINRKAAEAPQE